MKQTCVLSRKAWGVAAVLLLGIFETSSAQFIRGRISEPSGQFIEPDRALRQELSEAKEAIASQQYGDAIIILGDLLARKTEPNDSETHGQDFLIPEGDNKQSVTTNSLLRDAERMLAELPAKGLDVYALRYGATAAADLEQAVSKNDWAGIAAVSRQYFNTDAGREASVLLGYRHLVTGRPLAAALMFQRLHEQPVANQQYGTPLTVALAGSWYQAGKEDLASELLAKLSSGQQVRLQGQAVALPEQDPKSTLEWLETNFPRLEVVDHDKPREQPIAGGSISRTGYRGGELPMQNERWMKRTTWSVRQQEYLAKVQSKASPPVIPTWQPIVVGNTVMAKTTEGMVAVDFNSGKFIWEYPWFSENLSGGSVPTSEIPNDDERHRLLQQRVWNDLPYGRISSDGKRVFMLMGLGEVRPTTLSRFGPLGNQGVTRSEQGINSLIALDIETEGKLVWTAGNDELANPILSDVFFLGPPLPVESQLYIIGEQKGDVYLYCLDAETGDLQWKQHLVAVESRSIENDPRRRIGGAMPAYADGTLVCPTGNGAIVAFDLATRTFLWGFRYQRTDNMIPSRSFSSRVNRDLSKHLERWNDGTPMISQGRVLVTPVESDTLYALDLSTGKMLWPTVSREQEWIYLAGIKDESALLVGQHKVEAYSIKTGSRIWSYRIDDESIVGRGVFGTDTYLIPTNQQHLIAIDLANGTERDRRRVRYPLGNLVSVRGELLSQSPTHLVLARGFETTKAYVKDALLADPEDLNAIASQGELYLESKNYTEALKWLRNAYEKDPENEDVRVLLVESMIAALLDDFQGHAELVELLGDLTELPEERSQFLRIMASGSLAEQDLVQAAKYLIELSAPTTNLLGMEVYTDAETIELGASSRCTLKSWIGARIREIDFVASDADRKTINKLLEDEIATLPTLYGRHSRQLLDNFGKFPATSKIRNALADRYLQEGSVLLAERCLLQGIASDLPESTRDPWIQQLAKLYADAGWHEDALEVLDQLPDGNPLADELRGQQGLLLPLDQWYAHIDVKPASYSPVPDTYGKSDMLHVAGRRGQILRDWKFLLGENTDSILMRTPYGTPGVQYNLESGQNTSTGPKQIFIDRGVMIAVLPSLIVAIDLFRGLENDRDLELWRRSWRGASGGDIQSRKFTNPFGQSEHEHLSSSSQLPALRVSPIVSGQIVLLQSNRLTAVDILTGEDRWSRTIEPVDGHLAASDGVVSVVSSQQGQVFLFDAQDGNPIGKQAWIKPQENVWAVANQNVLSYVSDESGLNLRLWNAADGKALLNVQGLPPKVRGRVTENRYLTLLQPDGKLVLWDLVEARQITETELPVGETLEGLQAFRWQDKLLVMPKLKSSPDPTLKLINNVGDEHVAVNGPVMAFRIEDGKPAWEQPASIRRFGFTVEQASGGPLAFFSRREKYTQTGNAPATWKISVLGLDIRTGEIVDRPAAKGLDARSVPIEVKTHLSIDPANQAYAVTVDRKRLLFKLQETPPRDPEPPKQNPEQTSVIPKKRAKPFGLFEAVE